MRRLLLVLLLLCLPPASAGLLDNRPAPSLNSGTLNNSSDFLPVRQAFRLTLAEQTPEALVLRFVAAEGYYLYRHRLHVQVTPAALSAGEVQLPPGQPKVDEFFGEVEVYYGVVDVRVPLNNPQQQPLSVQVSYQGCADKGLCYPPETETLDLGLGLAANTDGDAPARSWAWSTLALFFLAGLGLTFTPCVLPMLPIMSSVILRGQRSGWRGLSLSLAFVLPMAACFAVLGALMGVFGAGLNLQARLQSPWVLVPFAAFFAVFALAMFGLFELRLPRFISDPLDRLAGTTRGGSLWGAALLGVLSSLLVSPCVSAPLAGALLYISSSGDALGGGLQLFALGLGMGAPLVVFATGGGALLPKAGTWMLAVRNAFGVMLLGVSVWMLERVLPGPLALALWALLSLGVALYLLRLALHQPGLKRWLTGLGGVLLLGYALSASYGVSQGGSDPLRPWAGASAHERWQTLSDPQAIDAALLAARTAGQPLLLDWYADWCISCKVIEREVLNHPEVLEQLAGFTLIRFDMTRSTPEQRALLDRYQLFGPPAILLFAEDGREWQALRVVGEITAAEMAERLRQTGVQRP